MKVVRRLALLGLLLAGGAGAEAAIPTVGCPSDGQMGPEPAPRRIIAPVVPRALEPRLAYYRSEGLGVIGPRGWHCFGLYGSNGAILIVAPERHGANDLLRNPAPLRGPAIQISESLGSTSGRFAVARLVARLFPAHIDFARRVDAEQIEDPSPRGPYPADRIRRRGANVVEYTTPGRREGLGTHTRLAANEDPIHGLVILSPVDDWYTIDLAVRLPAAQAALAPAIIDEVHRRYGPRR